MSEQRENNSNSQHRSSKFQIRRETTVRFRKLSLLKSRRRSLWRDLQRVRRIHEHLHEFVAAIPRAHESEINVHDAIDATRVTLEKPRLKRFVAQSFVDRISPRCCGSCWRNRGASCSQFLILFSKRFGLTRLFPTGHAPSSHRSGSGAEA